MLKCTYTILLPVKSKAQNRYRMKPYLLMPGGEILEKSPDGLEPELIRLLMYQLLKGLAYMHSLNTIHRDIKP